ncbi:MAG: helix-turn-helix domain-containing protein [Christensenellales bacterium]|jgi:transcriptional regulator with XRE-family HTH domain
MVSKEIIGRIIRQLRESKGMTQEVLSGLAGLDRTHYSKIERGLRSPTIDTLFKISAALEISPQLLIEKIEMETNHIKK